MTSKFLCAFIILVNIFFTAKAYANAPFFLESFQYGTPKETIEALPNIMQGEEKTANELMHKEIVYAGHPWTGRLYFTNNKLTRLSLVEKYSRTRMNAITAYLKQEKYELLGMVLDNKAIDFFARIKVSDPETFQRNLLEEIRTTKFKRISYAWFDVKNVSVDLKQRVSTIGELLRTIDQNTREIEIVILGNKNNTPEIMIIDFFFPILDFQEQK